MSVNKRCRRRYPADFDLYIRYRHKRIFQAKAKNLCVDGMFIRTDSLSLPKGNLVDLEFSMRDRFWQVPAVVVHTSEGGFGVWFRKPQPALAGHLQAMHDASSFRRRLEAAFPQGTAFQNHHSQ